MKTIGITGNIGSGKDAVVKFIKEKYSIKEIDADKVGNETLEANKYLLHKFGDGIIIEGKINKENLFNAVFPYKDVARAYNRWIHPLITENITKMLMEMIDEKYVIVNAPLIFESRMSTDYLILVTCPDKQIWGERMIVRCIKKGIPYTRVEALMKLQFPEEQMGYYCDYEIDNSGDFRFTEEQITRVMNSIITKKEE